MPTNQPLKKLKSILQEKLCNKILRSLSNKHDFQSQEDGLGIGIALDLGDLGDGRWGMDRPVDGKRTQNESHEIHE